MAFIGEKIKELRRSQGGLSQEVLAEKLGVVSNTISRWETGTYKPSVEDLDKLARFFSISILDFFPSEKTQSEGKLNALFRAAKELPEQDIDELQRYAEFRRARNQLAHSAKGKSKKKT